jgi:acyl-CoA thioesterase
MDSAVSFTPLALSGMYLDDAAACSSLDFSLRIFSNRIAMEDWHLREWRTHASGEGRTFSESRVWDERGGLVASMSQQSILRAFPEKAKL